MPHLAFSIPPKLSYPFEEKGYRFIECFTQSPTNSLIWIQYEEKNFFLRQQQKQDFILIKYDKQTRISPIGIIKDALNILKHRFSDILLYDNLSQVTLKQKSDNPYLITQDALYHLLKQQDTRTIELEIGFGSGRRILDKAKKHPDTLFIGVEIHSPSIEQVSRQITLQRLDNLYLLACDARILLESLSPNCIDQMIVHFPIPWKKIHRRIFNEHFTYQAQRALKKQGVLHLRTDDEGYFQKSLELVLTNKQSHCEIFKNKPIAISSKYEDRWHRQNKNIFDLFWYISKQNQEIKVTGTLSFSNDDIQRLYQFFIQEIAFKKIITDHALLSIKAVYRAKEALAISLCMGSLIYPQNTYLILTNNQAFYCPSLFLIDASYEAHQLLKQYPILKEKS